MLKPLIGNIFDNIIVLNLNPVQLLVHLYLSQSATLSWVSGEHEKVLVSPKSEVGVSGLDDRFNTNLLVLFAHDEGKENEGITSENSPVTVSVS